VNVRRSDNGSRLSILGVACEAAEDRRVLSEHDFRRMISLERKRSERSRNPFLLILVDFGQSLASQNNAKTVEHLVDTLACFARETDVTGWYAQRSIIGILFTEIGAGDRSATLNTLITRVADALQHDLSFEQFNQVTLSFHIFPDESGGDGALPTNSTLYPDLKARENATKSLRIIKRMIDMGASLAALIFVSPAFLMVALAIKLTSKGPIFFRQPRIGHRGVPFSLLKFRSMYANSDSKLHKEYVRQLIAGIADKHPSSGNGRGVYKLTRDPRITAVGAFLRRSSLDELPQLINVLKGEMSLVGPRPPIDYEVEKYELWHRRRLMEAKPGITGLWQVGGRNRIAFDDMVRLDLLYAKAWSLWLDLKILARTPKAVIEGAH
jgi:lipopolysaccharide/colanic/teichoic acid biosynthesis glycosyltransferase